MSDKKNHENKDQKNPWTPEDEGDHYPSMKEWWCFETLFKTLDDNRKWNLKTSLAYELESPSCFFIYLLFDITNNKCIRHKAINDDINKLSHKKNRVDLKYENTRITGLYPKYDIHIQDDEQDLTVDMKYNAKILPHWSAQDSTNGYLPIGFDHYRYGWLLNCNLIGTMKIGDEPHKIKGKGYFERAWGNWSYSNPFQKLSGFRKTIKTYGNLINWWLSHQRPRIPNRISFTTENNFFGYDWFWGILNNDWSIFYGNSLFWINEGPAIGVLTLFTEGNNYIDFGDVSFRYNKTVYLKKYDMEYPTDITISGRHDKKNLELKVWPVCDPFEYIDEFKTDSFYKAFIMPEMPGRIKGIYTDNEGMVKLEGDCKLVQQRQPSFLGHNSLSIDFIKPPKGFGISFDLNSHYLKKKLFTKIQLAPHLKFKFNSQRIDLSKIRREKFFERNYS